jgi:polysaccharide deacetylase 2 family uncharacterized protein YibQ
MFSRKPTPALQGAGAGADVGLGARALRLVQSNPYIGVGAAGGLFLFAVAALLLAGDPTAGAPKVRVALSEHGSAEDGALRPGQTSETGPEGAAAVDPLLAALDSSETSEMAPVEAIITGPNGERTRIVTAGGGGAAALPPAPFAGMTQPGPGGLLPIIAADGRTAATAYARPFHSNGKPKVALIIGGLGIKADTTRAAIESLPPEVTLSFAIYADGLQGWIDLARQHGHEVLIEAPMEPIDYPQNDPGPFTLLANARPEDTAKRLDYLLARATGYFGVTNYMGSRFVTSKSAMAAFSNGLKKRGLAFIDDGSAVGQGGGIPRASASAMVDGQLSAEAISRALTGLESQANVNGQALGSGFGYAVTVNQVQAWARGLSARGYQLAPASALTVRR